MLLDYAPIIIACCALFLTIQEAWRSRKHRRLMCQPNLCSSISRLKNGTKTQFSLTLENNGLGPARIKDFEFFLDDDVYAPEGEYPLKEIAQILFKEYEGFEILTQSWMTPSYILPEKKEYLAIKFEVDGTGDEFEAQILEKAERANFVVYYESIYGEKDRLDTRE